MTAALFLAQRISAMVLALAVAVHLGTILYAVRGGLTAGDILARTHGNLGFALFYSVFVVGVAVHAPIGLRNVIREWTPWRGPALDGALAVFAVALLALGMRAVIAVYIA
ncbi:MAG TPA: succinate dehydrogenase [Xanthobacteraceae bacterium]|nr:succinate dehydrogenase [Xanthobacteraceae bacterium]